MLKILLDFLKRGRQSECEFKCAIRNIKEILTPNLNLKCPQSREECKNRLGPYLPVIVDTLSSEYKEAAAKPIELVCSLEALRNLKKAVSDLNINDPEDDQLISLLNASRQAAVA